MVIHHQHKFLWNGAIQIYILPEVKTQFIVNISGMIDANWNSFFYFKFGGLFYQTVYKRLFLHLQEGFDLIL